MDNSQPLWAQALGADPKLRDNFASWVKDRTTIYAKEGITLSKDIGDVLGYRYMIGELEALVGMVFWNVEEEARRQHAFSQLVDENKPKSKRRRRR